MRTLLKESHGLALVVVIMMMAILLSISGSALLFSGLEQKTTSYHKTGTTAFHAAEAGVQHALAIIPSGSDFNSVLQGTVSGFSCLDGSGNSGACDGVVYFPTLTGLINGYSYTVIVKNDTTVPGETEMADNNRVVVLTSTAVGPNNANQVVVAYIGRSSSGFGLGATSMPGSNASTTETNFSGTSFSINGNDNCGAAPTVPGIAVTDPALKTEMTNSTTSDGGLASNQMGNVVGAGGNASVQTVPPLSQSVSQIADNYLTLTHDDLPSKNYSGTENWGTSSVPKITRITGGAQITGNITGYGVLIVDGALDISGNFTFNGLVIARGGDVRVQVTGNASIYGSVMIAPKTTPDAAYELDVRGNAVIRYDSCALASADSWKPLPRKAAILAFHEKLTPCVRTQHGTCWSW